MKMNDKEDLCYEFQSPQMRSLSLEMYGMNFYLHSLSDIRFKHDTVSFTCAHMDLELETEILKKKKPSPDLISI